MTEEKLQAECFKWAINKYPCLRFGCLFHVPNGGTRNKREAIALKATGVVAGIPDLMLINKGRVIGIEMKTTQEQSKLSPAQERVHKAWKDQGIDVFVVRSFEEFKELIKSIIE
jgi:hypothetical protein